MEKGLAHYTSYSYQKGTKYNTDLQIVIFVYILKIASS